MRLKCLANLWTKVYACQVSGFWSNLKKSTRIPLFSRECRKCSMHAWLKTENFNRNLKSLASIQNYFVLCWKTEIAEEC